MKCRLGKAGPNRREHGICGQRFWPQLSLRSRGRRTRVRSQPEFLYFSSDERRRSFPVGNRWSISKCTYSMIKRGALRRCVVWARRRSRCRGFQVYPPLKAMVWEFHASWSKYIFCCVAVRLLWPLAHTVRHSTPPPIPPNDCSSPLHLFNREPCELCFPPGG